MEKIINSEVEENIDNISYYYARKKRMNDILELMTKKYDEINKLGIELDKIRRQLDKDIHGIYSDVFKFDNSGGSYTTKLVRKKKEKGRLEDLSAFINEQDEKSAINKYLASIGARFYKGEIWNINDLLGIETEEDENLDFDEENF